MDEETKATEYPQIDLDSFIAWAQEKPSRTVKIKINDIDDTCWHRVTHHAIPVIITVWAYDYDLQTGQNLKGTEISVDQINLEALCEEGKEQKAKKLREQIAESQKQLERLEAE